MKRLLALATLFVFFCIPSFAAKNTESVVISSKTRAGSVDLPPGNYDVSWSGTGSDVQVTFTLQRKVIATVPAKLVMESNKDERVETKGDNGVNALETVRTKNKTFRFE